MGALVVERVEVFGQSRITLPQPIRAIATLQAEAGLPPAGNGAETLGHIGSPGLVDGTFKFFELRCGKFAQAVDLRLNALAYLFVEVLEGAIFRQPATAGRVARVDDLFRCAVLWRFGIVEAAAKGEAVVQWYLGHRLCLAEFPEKQTFFELAWPGYPQALVDWPKAQTGNPALARLLFQAVEVAQQMDVGTTLEENQITLTLEDGAPGVAFYRAGKGIRVVDGRLFRAQWHALA
ncbi:hypothetical protein D9M71_440330 [compost metagenome]